RPPQNRRILMAHFPLPLVGRVRVGGRENYARDLSPLSTSKFEYSPPPARGRTMKGSRFKEEQIIAILREQEAGAKTADVCRKHGISGATFYNWKSKYGGLEVSDARRLKVL